MYGNADGNAPRPEETSEAKRPTQFGAVAIVVGALVGSSSCGGSEVVAPIDPVLRFGPPVSTAFHNQEWRYIPRVSASNGAAVTLNVQSAPDWVSFDEDTGTLFGTPGWDNITSVVIAIRADAGDLTRQQQFTLTVSVGPIDCSHTFGDPAESSYTVPLRVGVETEVTQGYCRPPGASGHSQYYALDLSGGFRDTIYAARAGTVTGTKQDLRDDIDVVNNFVYVTHDDSTIARYVHFSTNSLLVQVGQIVNQGDPLGLIGRTPGARTHVHLDVFHDGRWDNESFATGRRYSLPVNFSNADGPLDSRRGLIAGESYEVLPRP